MIGDGFSLFKPHKSGCANRIRALTHNLTHIRKQAGGGNGTESTIAPDFLEQKRPQSAKWRRFEGGVSVGKDEVSVSFI